MSWKTTEFESLLEAVPDALVGADEAGVIRFVNRQTEMLFGYERAEMLGAPLEMLVPEPLRAGHVAHREEFNIAPRSRSMGTDLNLVGLRKDGSAVPVDISLAVLQNEDGRMVVAAVRDMSAHRRLEAERRRADRLLAIVEFSDDAIIGATLDGIVTSWNPAAEKIFGYTSAEITGKSVDVLIPEDLVEEMQTIQSRILDGEHIDHFDAIRIRKDGTRFPVSLSVSPIRDDDSGVVVGISTTAWDVTEARQAFEAARAMMEASLDSLVAINPAGKITDANDATVRLTGVPREKLIGTSFSDYFTDPAKADKVYQQAFDQARTGDYQLTLRHHNGHETLTEVLYNASVQRDENGRVVGVFAAARDLTQQAQAFEAARSMIEASLDSLVAISPQGKITDANEATVRLTGVPREQLIGTSFSKYFTDPQRAQAIYEQVLSEGVATDYPLTLRHHNGHETFTEVLYNASAYRDGDGHVLGVFAAARDVTSQVQAQKAISQQQAREQERLAELERFQRLTVGRELKMIELKKEIEYLRRWAEARGDEPPPG